MIKKSLFIIFACITALILIFYAQIGIDNSLAIIAEVEPQKTAVSFSKSVRINELKVKPGQHVQKGDLLLVAERPNLSLEIEMVYNGLKQLTVLESKLINEYEYFKRTSNLKLKADTIDLNQRINILKVSYGSDTLVYDQISSRNSHVIPSYEIKIAALISEKELLYYQTMVEIQRRKAEFDKEIETITLQRKGLKSELLVLENEQVELRQYSPFSGTVGSVSVQLMQLVPPYQTIISIYEEHPTVIKAYLNELATANIAVGEEVKVSSINRNYSVPGKVVEIGSRIVSYPQEMNAMEQQNMRGKEIFVTIGNDNTFLSGEKVYVILNAK